MLVGTALLGAVESLAGCPPLLTGLAPCFALPAPKCPHNYWRKDSALLLRLSGKGCAQVKAHRYFYLLKLHLTFLPQCSPPVQHRFNPTSPVLLPQDICGWGSFLVSQHTAVSEWFYSPLFDVFFWFNLYFFFSNVYKWQRERQTLLTDWW